MQKQLESAKATASNKEEWFEPGQLDPTPAQKTLRQWIKHTMPELHEHYEAKAWKCTISEHNANHNLVWKSNIAAIN